MSPAITSTPSSYFLLLLLGSSSPHRRRGRVSALRSCGGVGLHWTHQRLSRVGTVICATAAGGGGGRGREESAANAAAGESAKPGDVRSSTIKVAEKKDPVPSVNSDASESTAKAELSAPEQDTSIAKRNGALGSSANKSVTSQSSSAVASKENASGNIPAKKSELESKSKVVPLAPASKSETVSNAKAAASKDAKVGVLSESKIPSPLPMAQGPPALNDKNEAGVAGRVEAKADTGVVAKEASCDDDDQNKDAGPLAGVNVMNVIVVAAECSPWCKTGGLGDVAGALPKALARRGHRVMVVVPRYGEYAQAKDLGVRRHYKVAGQDSEVSYFHSYMDGVDFVFLDAPPFRHRHGDIYGGERSDVLKRMILFCKAAVEVPWHAPCGGVCYGDGNLVFIANDWHTALLPVYLKAYYRDNGLMQFTRSILVIHNIAHQGRGPVDDFFVLDLPEHYIEHFKLFDPVGGDHNNIFAAGLKMADRVVTVSHGYLWELKTSEGGWGLHEIINQNDWKLHGIVNGIDMGEWNPEVDVHLQSDGYTNYSLQTVDIGKRKCKAALQRQFGLQVRDDVPLIGFIGRLDPQKGVDIIADAMHWIAGQDVQLIMLGTGRPDLEDMLRRFEAQHHDKVRGWVGFSVQMAHRITAGVDVLVMPSRFEPCGLNQLYAMAYGTVPVVHAVGGLRDTVAPFDPFKETGLGWTFDRAEPNKLIEALGHCLNTYRNYKESWRGLQERGMSQDLSWDHAGQLYEDVLVKAKYQW